jgi:hypothetical protein
VKKLKKSTKTKARSTRAPKAPPPPVAMRDLVTGYWVSQLVFVAAKLQIADLLGKKAKTPEQLAKEAGVQAAPLARVLRALASVGIFQEAKDGTFKSTPLSDTLRTDAPQSMKSFALMIVEDYNWKTWGWLIDGVKNGGVPFHGVHGMRVFSYFDAHPDDAKVFGEAMTSISGVENPAVANAYDFSRFKTLVDVGGSQGHLLAAILSKFKKLRGILFDQASVIERARTAGYVTAPAVRGRVELVPGNFFEAVPEGADAYLMKYVLHDWDDETCVKILSHCRRAMAPKARVLVADCVIEPGNAPSWGKLLDVNMLVATGGKERTRKEFAALLERADLEMVKIHPTACDLSIVEAVAR